MISIKRILCPVDFFAPSNTAVAYATGLAQHYGAGIHLLHVVAPIVSFSWQYPLDASDIMRNMEQASAEQMKPLIARITQAGVEAVSEVRVGDTFEEIKRAMATLKPELVIMGTHGRRGAERWFLGSTTEKLLRHSSVPVLTIRPQDDTIVATPRFRNILVTTDFSSGTPEALAYAFSLAQENESKVTLLHVNQLVGAKVSRKYHDDTVDFYHKELKAMVPPEARTWCDVVTKVESGTPYRVILRMLEEEHIDLLVMNIHGKGMLDRALLGSTADRVVRAAACPVMMIPPMKASRKRRARLAGSRVAA